MKKVLLTVLLLLGFTHAANIMQVAESSQPLQGALENFGSARGSLSANYIPGYGFALVGSFLPANIGDTLDRDEVIQAAQDIITGLAPTVTGLDEGEWVSVSATIVQGTPTFVTIRVQPNQPDTLEVWVDGVKR